MELLTSRDYFGKLCELHKKTGLGAEIGVQYGNFSQKIAEYYTGKVLCIDLWGDEKIYFEAQKNLADKNKFKLYRADSLCVAEFIPDNTLDFVYIDANHHYKEVLADIKAWYPKVISGGIVAGHDYCVFDDIQVIDAVNDWCRENSYSINLIKGDYFEGQEFPTWWFIKR